MNVSIIIVNWNSAEYTAACVSSVRTTTKGLQYEIIVVDNASSDDSVDVLRRIPDIKLLASSENLGFARANNLGYQLSSGDVLLFLNPDTVVQDGAIARMYAALCSSPHWGSLGCKLLNSDHSLQTSCVQAFPTIINQLADVESLKLRFRGADMWGMSALFQEHKYPVPVEVVSGACLMIRKEVFRQVGFFSTDYFMYCEDVDLCYKVGLAGLLVGYVADVTVVHHGGQSSKQAKDSSFGDVLTREAIDTFLAKTRGRLYARGYSCAMCFAALVRLVLLTVLPVSVLGKDQEGASMARRKWRKILRWSLGRESWAKRLAGRNGLEPQYTTVEGTR